MQNYTTDIQVNKDAIRKIFTDVINLKSHSDKKVEKILRKYPDSKGIIMSKGAVIRAVNKLSNTDNFYKNNREKFLTAFKMKRVRTQSGVTPVTVLTKPFPCPGKCIFCPNDVRMPKSYLASEPGAQRAETNKFDPYLQTHNRLAAMHQTGHNVSKVELIILGGTWSSYPLNYQIWFVKRCFDAINEFDKTNKDFIKPEKVKNPILKKPKEINGEKLVTTYNKAISKALDYQSSLSEKASWKELFASHKINQSSSIRCIGLSLETRPDEIDKAEVIKLRKLGATKIQIGIQSMNDKVLKLNKRGHDVAKTEEAIRLLRTGGFKIQAHYMPNLLGSSPTKDVTDFKKLYTNKNIRPDELKVYPCSLIQSAELMKYYKNGKWKPYKREELLKVLTQIEREIPEYTRVTRVIRDIPGTDIVVGNKTTNFRQVVEKNLKDKNIKTKEIRSREIKSIKINMKDLKLKKTMYETTVSKEYFLQFVNKNNKIAGFLRLSIPISRKNKIFKELDNCAIIREIHVYGEVVDLGKDKKGKAQHIGIGKRLIKEAESLSKKAKYSDLAVISSIGTREYYKKQGFNLKDLYQIKNLD